MKLKDLLTEVGLQEGLFSAAKITASQDEVDAAVDAAKKMLPADHKLIKYFTGTKVSMYQRLANDPDTRSIVVKEFNSNLAALRKAAK